MDASQIEVLIAILNRQTIALERIADAVEQITATNATPPNYQRPLEEFGNFSWDSIGVAVERSDQYGAAIVNWKGYQFVRRSPTNKFGAAIWFSRCTGKDEEGNNKYDRLITFKPISLIEVDALPDKVAKFVSK